MPDRDTFLRMIIDNPDDDGPRLVYADWLEEQGDADRAEFIRVQIEIEQLPMYSPRRVALERRERELEVAHGRVWARPVTNLIPADRQFAIATVVNALADNSIRQRVASYQFRRGFVEDVLVTVPEFLDHGAELVRVAPVRDLTLYLSGGVELTRVAAAPQLAAIRALHFANELVPVDSLVELLQSPYSAGLNTLDLKYQSLPGDAFKQQQFSRLARMGQISHLILRGNVLGFSGLPCFTQGETAAVIRTLDLSQTQLGPFATRALAESSAMTALTELDLSEADAMFDRSAARAFANNPAMRLLSALDLTQELRKQHNVWLRGPELEELCRTSVLGSLTRLSLGGADVVPDMLAQLQSALFWKNLTSLSLSSCPLTDLGRDPARFAGLNQLDLGHTEIADADIADLASAPLPELHALWLAATKLTDTGAAALARSPHLSQLTYLDLSGTQLTDTGAKRLANSPYLPHLDTVDVSQTAVGERGVAALRERLGEGVVT